MKVLEFLRDFELNLSGSSAWFALMCMAFVLIDTVTQILGWILKYLH